MCKETRGRTGSCQEPWLGWWENWVPLLILICCGPWASYVTLGIFVFCIFDLKQGRRGGVVSGHLVLSLSSVLARLFPL